MDVYRIYDTIYTQIIKPPHYLLFHLGDLDYGRNPDIGTLKKERGGIFSECCKETFKEKFPQYVNVVLFEMVKKSLKDTYIWGKTPTKLKNKVSAFHKMYYDR